MKQFWELYREDILSFKKHFDANYIKNVFDAYEEVKDKLEALALIRDIHLSRMFSFLLMSYFVKREPDKIDDAINITIKNLGDAVIFLSFYKKKFKELPYGPFREALKQHLNNLDDEKIELFKYFTVNDKAVQKYLEELGYEINEEFLRKNFPEQPRQGNADLRCNISVQATAQDAVLTNPQATPGNNNQLRGKRARKQKSA
ncbi:hypothetical protein A3L04_08475 [Thermococcus chitonophagus]|uniref:Uncharacterized protein n=1 Tax=Thermococcus chitonophagus TaxID=54262 RepID=A0A160VRX2_9EURY|nr:hypothetical protein A3L04_08475 [Thermococcus chitonophagus]CUX77705.1 hypothetical protein CHITON_0926 [Thermococcus chitonophagus]